MPQRSMIKHILCSLEVLKHLFLLLQTSNRAAIFQSAKSLMNFQQIGFKELESMSIFSITALYNPKEWQNETWAETVFWSVIVIFPTVSSMDVHVILWKTVTFIYINCNCYIFQAEIIWTSFIGVSFVLPFLWEFIK